MRHVYHYCAKNAMANGFQTVIDGILDLESPIEDMESYRKAKELVEDQFRTGSIVIESLTKLS